MLATLSVYTFVETVIFLGCLALAYSVFDIVVQTVLVQLIGIIAAFAVAMTSFALFVGTAVRKISSTITLPLFYIMPSVLFSGAIWPRYFMDAISLLLSYIMPIGYSTNTLRDVLLRGTGPTFASDVGCLLLFTFLMMSSAMWLVRKKIGKGETAHVVNH